MDPKLTDRIAQEVLAALGAGPEAPTAFASGPPPSQIPALAAPDSPDRDADEALPPAKRFITAEMLTERLTGSKGSTVELGANEHLTPAAADLAARRRLRITRLGVPTVAKRPASKARSDLPAGGTVASHRPGAAAGPVGIVVERRTDKVESILRALGHDGIRFTEYSKSDCWIVNLRTLCQGVCGGRLILGVAVIPYGAEAMVIANKIKGIRAVQGTCPASVAAGVRRIGANVLILEHELSTFYELRQMTRIFITNRMVTGSYDVATAAIDELEGT
ncbi:MAG: RpiB/LacA/LacB family sugar-phosphate isomerase [Phycisphaerae bacterium]|nr:RpiB/LacA/LacB family sugar-phosphate isomerase [Phycisphaerae bacterium]